MKNFNGCRKCYNKGGQYGPGYIIVHVGDNLTAVKECECLLHYRDEEMLRIKFERAGGDKKFLHYDIDKDYVPYVSDFSKDLAGPFVKTYLEFFSTSERTRAALLYFEGNNGTQKTTVANYIMKELLGAGFSVKYLLMNNLIKMLIKADRDEEVQQEIERLTDLDLLIIDEAFMKNKVTLYQSKFQIPFLDTFIRSRLNKGHGIIFISNVSPQEIEEQGFSKDIENLVRRQINIDKSHVYFTSVYTANKNIVSDKGLFS